MNRTLNLLFILIFLTIDMAMADYEIAILTNHTSEACSARNWITERIAHNRNSTEAYKKFMTECVRQGGDYSSFSLWYHSTFGDAYKPGRCVSVTYDASKPEHQGLLKDLSSNPICMRCTGEFQGTCVFPGVNPGTGIPVAIGVHDDQRDQEGREENERELSEEASSDQAISQ